MPNSTASKDELEYQLQLTNRERLFQRLQVTFDLIAGLPEHRDIFLTRADNCLEDLRLFESVQQNIEKYNILLKLDSSTQASSKSYEDLHFRILTEAKKIRQSLNAPVATTSNLSSIPNQDLNHDTKTLRPKLPPIVIPKFKGDIEKFPAFQSLFDTLVHDTNLPAIQKFAFLKSYLEYPASSVVDNFEFTGENYALAYENLVKRYTDVRLVGTHLLNKLLQFKPLANGTLHNLRQFVDVFSVHYASLKSLDIPDLADFIVFNLALKVLDQDTKRLFEDKFCNTDFPTYEALSLFIQEQAKVAALLQAPHNNKGSSTFRNDNRNHRFVKTSDIPAQSTKSFMAKSRPSKPVLKSPGFSKIGCWVCKAEHRIYDCPTFLSYSPIERRTKAQSLRLCMACLGGHLPNPCPSQASCRHCRDSSHHTLLHSEFPNVSSRPSNITSTRSSTDLSTAGPSVQALSCRTESKPSNHSSGLLATARARVQSHTGQWVSCRLVIDPASESSFITEALVQTLRLPRTRCPIDIVGIGSSSFHSQKGAVSCLLSPAHTEQPVLSVNAIILSNITSDLPREPLPDMLRERFANLRLADPQFDQPDRVDILLGVQHYVEILKSDTHIIPGEPSAINTIFGFILLGKIPNPTSPTVTSAFLSHNPSLDSLLQRFWEIEECQEDSKRYAIDTDCETIFSDTTTRDEQGRYQVSLPFKHNIEISKLGSTRHIAHTRLLALERRLNRQPEFRDQYQANLHDYVTQDHIRPALTSSDYLLTHHAVVKESTTTKVRVVFNGSERSDKAHSLNDFLLTGPKMQSDIAVILSKFRVHPITLTADIRQMFRCIRLNAADRRFTHFLWRETPEVPIMEWEFTTLPFGLTCSPYLAQRVIQRLLEDEGDPFPRAVEILSSNLYVDDLLVSLPSPSEAIQLYEDTTLLLSKGGFELRKFASNSAEVLTNIPHDHRENPLSFEESPCIKLLGLIWDPLEDIFTYRSSSLPNVSTKRGILSQVARIFDLLGFLAPVTFWIKYFIQKLWIHKLGWDERLPDDLLQLWTDFSGQLTVLTEIRISRYLARDINSELIIVGFCDASEKGYGACVYLVSRSNNSTSIHLLKAKSKVAPLKPVTIPRLELLAAVLLTKLVNSLKEVVSMLPPHRFVCCTDSAVVLAWINTPLYLLKTYVAHRVVLIVDSIEPNFWWHVPGRMNPADLASRGLYPRDMLGNSLWWSGPEFLSLPSNEWPLDRPSSTESIPEVKSEFVTLLVNPAPRDTQYTIQEQLLEKYSSLSRTQRVLGWIRRFIHNVRAQRASRNSGPLSTTELSASLDTLVKHTQHQYYSDVLHRVTNKQALKGPEKLLTPFIDSTGLLRVGGRLDLSPLPYSARHPYLLPRKSSLAKLVCREVHAVTLHGGVRLMQSIISRKYWIPGIRYLLRDILFHCVPCHRYKAKTLEPFMSSLPSLRFQCSRAFITTGIDLAGPYMIRESKRRNSRASKGWIVLFICLTTRAVHIDLVSDLSSSAFLASLDRFISRRGIPSTLCTDLGTNFVGAARELRETIETLRGINLVIDAYCRDRDICWRFNPPSAPNFGGGWEAAIKSMKGHLRRVLGRQTWNTEEFLTLLAKVEAILNSRPLCDLTSTPSDGFDVLTPGHFLVGAPLLLSRPEIDYDAQPINYRSRWELLSRSIQDIWKRWSREYLHRLMQRSKWHQQINNIRVGQMVLLQEKALPPTLWALGRILEILPGQDGVVRVVKLRTPQGIFTRPVNKLSLLPFGEENPDV